MRIACVQLRARDIDESDLALEEALESTERAAADADLIVLPEATYPGYVLHESVRFGSDGYERALVAFADLARRHAAWIAVGLVRPVERGLANSAVLIDTEGNPAAITDKAFLWHFDSRWFRPGAPGEVSTLPWGAVGMFVCADARMPEIPRGLAARGARLLLDPTALVLSPLGKNAQLEYMLSARAWENGAFLAVANKCGSEAGIARYGGCSAIFDPSGNPLNEAGADHPAIVVADVHLPDAPGPRVRPATESVRELMVSTDSLPIAEALAGSPPTAPFRVAMVRERVDWRRMATELGVDLVIGQHVSGTDGAVSLEDGGFRVGDTVYLSGEILRCEPATMIGFLAGDDGAAPEVMRALMLRGANLVIWDATGVDIPTFVLRTRADENRVFLVILGAGDRWQIFGPTGQLLGEGPIDGLDAVYVEFALALAWDKEMAPGTDIVRNRPVATG